MKKICPDCELKWVPHPKMKLFKDNIFWTFTKKEDKNCHLIDLEIFTQFSYDHLIKNIPYVFIDPILDKRTKIKRIIKHIKELKASCYYIYRDRFIYLYGNGILFGIDLDLCQFIGINKNKIKNALSSVKNTTLLTDDILIKYKSDLTRLNDNVRFFPFLYNLDEKNNSIGVIPTIKES